jgi:hypothetical protein
MGQKAATSYLWGLEKYIQVSSPAQGQSQPGWSFSLHLYIVLSFECLLDSYSRDGAINLLPPQLYIYVHAYVIVYLCTHKYVLVRICIFIV